MYIIKLTYNSLTKPGQEGDAGEVEMDMEQNKSDLT
jgi:hypothetical protein